MATLALLLPLAVLLALLYPLLPVLPLGLPEGLVRALAGAGEALTVLVPPLEGLLGGADWAVLGQVVLAANVVVLLFRGSRRWTRARCARRSSGHRTARQCAEGPPGLSGPLSLALGALAAFWSHGPHALFTGAALAAQPVLTQVLQPPPGARPGAGGPWPHEPTPSDPFAAVLPQLRPPDARPVWTARAPSTCCSWAPTAPAGRQHGPVGEQRYHPPGQPRPTASRRRWCPSPATC